MFNHAVHQLGLVSPWNLLWLQHLAYTLRKPPQRLVEVIHLQVIRTDDVLTNHYWLPWRTIPRVIQSELFLSPIVGGHLTFEFGSHSPSPKGHFESKFIAKSAGFGSFLFDQMMHGSPPAGSFLLDQPGIFMRVSQFLISWWLVPQPIWKKICSSNWIVCLGIRGANAKNLWVATT